MPKGQITNKFEGILKVEQLYTFFRLRVSDFQVIFTAFGAILRHDGLFEVAKRYRQTVKSYSLVFQVIFEFVVNHRHCSIQEE
jgi:hypothetical protein